MGNNLPFGYTYLPKGMWTHWYGNQKFVYFIVIIKKHNGNSLYNRTITVDFWQARTPIVVATSPARHHCCHCHHHFLFLRIQPLTNNPWLPTSVRFSLTEINTVQRFSQFTTAKKKIPFATGNVLSLQVLPQQKKWLLNCMHSVSFLHS